MVQVKIVSTNMGAAARGLSLTFTNLEEVQTERIGERKNQKDKQQQNTYTKNIHTAGAGSRTEGKEKQKTKYSCSHQSTAGFFY